MGANVSEEAVAALNTLVGMLEKSTELVEKSISRLQSTLDTTKSTLGPYAEEVAALIETVKQDSADGNKGVKILVLKLRRGIANRLKILEERIQSNGRRR